MANNNQKRKKNVSDYEQHRHKNIEENQVMLRRLMTEFNDSYRSPVTAPARKPREQKNKNIEPSRRNPLRASRYTPYNTTPTHGRVRRGSLSTDVSEASSSSPATSPNRLLVRFGFGRKKQSADSDTDSAEAEDSEGLSLPSRVHRIVREAKPVEEITQEDIDMVATSTSDKKYDSFFGTTCHQCRQKTSDMKTICRSGDCFGVRGQFCGPCLRNRYGEDAKEVLKNKNWVCPPCRGICNCSFCRKRSGKNCTGILIHMARERGYSNVSDYLKGLKK